ncbi:MAG TPA: type II toxin-antitoxin system prevent-host-death family antitoxin [Phycisphaerae bacterium]|nr:type II toxin-antitoxin system prevent-host-death family antitoxin [Phycisphaerae bacterium]
MNRLNMREARRRFSDMVNAAEHGESTVITRRGRQVARVEPVGPAKGRTLPDLSEFRASIRTQGKPLSRVVMDRRKEARY